MINDSVKAIAIVGASGHGKVIAELAETLGYSVNFYDDAYPSITCVEHWHIKGKFEDLLRLEGDEITVFVAIGNNHVRELKVQLLNENKFALATLIHPSANVSKYAVIEHASVVLAGAVINAFATVGTGCIINSGAIVEHDCNVADFVHISPNAALAGGVTIGKRSWIGIGANVNQLLDVGFDTIIGAGSTVVKSIGSNVIAYGSPALTVKNNT